jgi:hypothetical protein
MHRILKKVGVPLLYVPQHPKAALETLNLYPAQRGKARLAKRLCQWAVGLRVPLPFGKSEAPVVPLDCIQWSDTSEAERITDEPVYWGVFTGNPSAPGRRFLYLVFNAQGAPLYLIKAGFDAEARAKIEAERRFLISSGARRAGVFTLWGALREETCAAIVLPYFRGKSPGASPLAQPLCDLMQRWQCPERTMLHDIPAWQALVAAGAAPRIADREVSQVLGHGDLAPWNVIVDASGLWQVIDWERGSESFVPGWDWMHYVVQPSILVKQDAPARTFKKVVQLLASTAFIRYAEKTGIRGIEWELFEAYLLHCREVLRPTEGSHATDALLAALPSYRFAQS